MDAAPIGGSTAANRRARWILGLLALTWLAVTVPVVRTSVLRPVLAVPAAVLLPGYAVLSALVPVHGPTKPVRDPVVRACFAVAIGVSTVVLLGVALALAPVRITAATTLVGVSLVTLLGLATGAYRAAADDDRDRQGDDAGELAADGHARTGSPSGSGRPGLATTDRPVVRAVGVVVLVAGVVGLGASAYLLTIHDQPGFAAFGASPVDAGPNGSVLPGEPLELSLENGGSQTVTYTVVASVERADSASGEALAGREVERFDVELTGGESWTDRHVPPTPWPDETRAVYALYRGEEATGPPDARVHRWIENAPGEDGGSDR